MINRRSTELGRALSGFVWFKQRVTPSWVAIVLFVMWLVLFVMWLVLYVNSFLPEGFKIPVKVSPSEPTGIALAILFLVLETLRHSIERIDQHGREIEKLQENNNNIVRELYRPCTKLGDCQEEILQRLRESEKSTLSLDHLALDMGAADADLERIVSAAQEFRVVRLRILMIAPEVADDAKLPEEIRDFGGVARVKLRKIQETIKRVLSESNSRAEEFEAELRVYKAIPVHHGIEIFEPYARAYVSECSYRIGHCGPQYSWGPDSYAKIDKALVHAHPRSLHADKFSCFRGQFDHLWANSKLVLKKSSLNP